MEKEVIQFMMTQIEKIGTQQEAILVKTAELSVEQKHLSHSVDEIKEDIASIQTVQIEHSSDIREIKEALTDNQSFKDFVIEFAKTHPIISFIIFLMVVNIVLTSIGLPIIQLAPIWATLVGGT